MNILFLLAIITTVLVLTYVPIGYSQTNETGLDFDEPVSQIASDLANYHYKLGENASANGDEEAAKYHFALAGMTDTQINEQIDRTLGPQEREKMVNSGPGNCIVSNDTSILCGNEIG